MMTPWYDFDSTITKSRLEELSEHKIYDREGFTKQDRCKNRIISR